MFADDKKICRGIYTVEDQESLQDDLDKLISWSEEWLLKFNPEKCKMMRIGHGLQTEYDMTENGISHQLQVSQEEKDLGIYILQIISSLVCSVPRLPQKQCRYWG